MPCSKCTRRSQVERPNADQWGPLLWTLLHGLSLKRAVLDSFKLRTLKVKWKQLFELLPNIVPCSECKEHLEAYIKVANPNTINSQEDFSDWFYLLHEAVNKQLGKPSFDKANLQAMYSTTDLRSTYYKYDKLMEPAVQSGDASLLSWSKMKTVLLFLFSFYNL